MEEDAGNIISSMCALSLFDDTIEQMAESVTAVSKDDLCIRCETPEYATPKKIHMIQSPTSAQISSKALTNRSVMLSPTPEDFKEAGRVVKLHLLYKTSWCRQQICPYDRKCRFCHRGELLRPRPSQSIIDDEIALYAWRLAIKKQEKARSKMMF